MNDKITVLHIVPSVSGYGAERLVVELLKNLASPQINVALLTIYETPEETRAALPFPIHSARRKHRHDRLFFYRLVREIRSCKPDVVHTHTHVGKYWGRFAAMVAGARTIIHTEHNPCDFRRTPLERVSDWLLHRGTSRVVTFFAEQGDAIVRRENLPAHKLVIIPNAVRPCEQRNDCQAARDVLSLERDDFAIMVIGRMEYQKNHILALRAFAALPATLRDRALLLFAGSGKDEEVLRGLSHALAIGHRVRFLGYRSDLAALINGADLVLMTSWFEGMPLALLEAMIAGVPIVTTPWIGARNMFDNGRLGFITAGFAPDEVAAAIERAIARPKIRANVAARAKQHVDATYDMAKMIDAHQQLYLQACGKAA
ncbi:MAG: glycosyltransferase [Candidatus Eremiobacteraeota bacterium]|nr:glycosyltransferase [Candidatus Eremiobacteraeota bacterium]MBV9055383.1 glycosyltransferase [Candidatus Eremiobacteraeota bacterium]MBV9700190.1 glycosyltransferase [Candidatus Eremiobacteraeota bacterium]